MITHKEYCGYLVGLSEENQRFDSLSEQHRVNQKENEGLVCVLNETRKKRNDVEREIAVLEKTVQEKAQKVNEQHKENEVMCVKCGDM